jgi:prolipoprotein diacylglyceryltransferase
MWEEAPKTEIFGIQVYTFGLYCAIGALCAVAAIGILCRAEKLKKGTDALLSLLCLLCGTICSRIVFCLLNDVAFGGVPFHAWFHLSIGGFSLFGMIFGVFLGAWICSKTVGERADSLLDIVSVGLPLMIAAERFGERVTEGFNISRQLTAGSFPDGTFLSVRDLYYENVSFLATYLLCAICAVILFLILVFFLTRERADGDLWILFMMLCGAGGVILESLRYDHFLEYSFVCFQQIFAAILLVWGVILAGIRNRGSHPGIFRAAIISLPLSIALCGGIEFALDRMSISHYVLYIIMLAALAVPVTLGILLLVKREKPA